MQLHPIMYVPDQYAERDFYSRFGFTTVFEGDEFPGFLAIKAGDAVLGLQRFSTEHPAYVEGLRWQFQVESTDELDAIIATCDRDDLEHEMQTESGGSRFRSRLVKVRSPAGHWVWFEGPNQAD